ncbi:MAG: membrane protein insertion efficiency factor YidD [Pseudobdellovibrio sp.]
MSNIFIFLIKIYQYTFSYFLGGHCRFYPSCSHYAIESFQKHSPSKAFILTVIRILKCNPLYPKTGYDPVPSTKENV